MRNAHYVQPLESRLQFAAISWDGGGDGINWDSRNNWSNNQVPTINDDVTINVPGSDPTITIRTNAACRNLNTRETVYLSYPGTFVNFQVAQTVTLDGADFRMENVINGGTWNGTGKIIILNNAALMVAPGPINCDIAFEETGTSFGINGDLVFNGTMVLGAPGDPTPDSVSIDGEVNRSITGTGTFVFEGTDPLFSSKLANNTLAKTLTIGPDIKLVAHGTGRLFNNYFGCRTIFQGTIDSTAPGAVFSANASFVNQGGTVKVAGGGIVGLFLDDTSVIGPINLQSGGGLVLQSAPQVLGGQFTFNVNQPITVPEGASLALSGLFNINADVNFNGDLILEYTGNSYLDLARTKLTAGYANGAWNGPGIRSSRAASTPGLALGFGEASEILGAGGGTFGPFTVDGSAVLVRLTRYGDVNLDRTVNLSDFNALAGHFGATVSAWNRGDFNFDGHADLLDFNRLASQFGQSVSASLPARPDPFVLDELA
jgi:hypothetical protein